MIYLDANATSKLRPEAEVVLRDFFSICNGHYGNPSSVHSSGRFARAALEKAREQLLSFLRCDGVPGLNVVFTSGGTEACNLMLRGFLGTNHQTKIDAHIVCSAIEHPAVLEVVNSFSASGYQVTLLLPEANGVISADTLIKEIKKNTVLVSLMAANNETGAMQPILAVTEKLRQNGFQGVIVSDFTQALGKSEIDVKQLFAAGLDALAVSGHKVGALPGVGALILADHSAKGMVCRSLTPLLLGGPQEKRFRAGTENLPGIISFGVVLELLKNQGAAEREKITALRENFLELLQQKIPDIFCLTPLPQTEITESALSNTLALRFSGCRGDDLVVALDLQGVAASTGSACASGKQEVSHVLRAMGLSNQEAREVVRFSLDWDAELSAIESAVKIIEKCVATMREINLKESPQAENFLQV